MSKQSVQYLGIDVGGNHVKMGFVDEEGHIQEFQSHRTSEWRETGNFTQRLQEAIAFKLIPHPEVDRVGIGLPGMISKDRNTPLEITAIPELNGTPLRQTLSEAMPNISFFLENDANAAALGELVFNKANDDENFLFITLGTGIGSAAIIDRRIFTGGDGNGLELGHILSRNGRKLEQNIGKQGILDMAWERLAQFPGDTTIARTLPMSATKMVLAAQSGDKFSQQVFDEVGEMLGEGLVALIRILDVKTVLIGGGLSTAMDFIRPGADKILNGYLTPYYLEKLKIRRAFFENDSGLLGAAAICF
ncbi:MAG: ROK family protein [Bacteroidota bacterium]